MLQEFSYNRLRRVMCSLVAAAAWLVLPLNAGATNEPFAPAGDVIGSSISGVSGRPIAADGEGNFYGSLFHTFGGGTELVQILPDGSTAKIATIDESAVSVRAVAANVRGVIAVAVSDGPSTARAISIQVYRPRQGFGPPLSVATIPDSAHYLDLAVGPQGDVLMVWQAPDQGDRDASRDAGIFARRFDFAGSPLGPPFLVNETIEGRQTSPRVAIARSGQALVTWNDAGKVVGRLIGEDGMAAGGATVLTTGGNSDVAARPRDGFVMSWTSSTEGVRAAFVSSEALGRVDPFEVAPALPAPGPDGVFVVYKRTSVASDARGGFMVAYDRSNFGVISSDEFPDAVFGRRLGPDGVAESEVFEVAKGNPVFSGIAMGQGGDALLVFAEGSNQTRGRMYAGFEPVDLIVRVDPRRLRVGFREQVTFTVTVDNAHPAATTRGVGHASGIAVKLNWPGAEPGSVNEGRDFLCSSGWESMTCFAKRALAPGESLEIPITYDRAPSQVENLEIEMTTTSFDPDSSDNAVRPVVKFVSRIPDEFDFQDRINCKFGTSVRSDIVTITGLTEPAPIRLGDRSAQYRINNGSFTRAPGTIASGDQLQLRTSCGDHPFEPRFVKVFVGGRSVDWVVLARDGETDPFDFVDVIDAGVDRFVVSQPVTVTGTFTFQRVRVRGEGSARLSIDGGPWVREGNMGGGQSIRLRLRSAGEPGVTQTATLTVGRTSDAWNVTTAP